MAELGLKLVFYANVFGFSKLHNLIY